MAYSSFLLLHSFADFLTTNLLPQENLWDVVVDVAVDVVVVEAAKCVLALLIFCDVYVNMSVRMKIFTLSFPAQVY